MFQSRKLCENHDLNHFEGLKFIKRKLWAPQNWTYSNFSNSEIGQNHDLDHFAGLIFIEAKILATQNWTKLKFLESQPYEKCLTRVVSQYTVLTI